MKPVIKDHNEKEGKGDDCKQSQVALSKALLKNKKNSFPLKLMYVLSIEEYSDIITWLPHGRAFAILSPQKLLSVILPLYFKKVQFSSFIRELTRWGFQRKLTGSESGSFYHKHFQRGNVTLCSKIITTEMLENAAPDRNDQKDSVECQKVDDQNKQIQNDCNGVPHQEEKKICNPPQPVAASRLFDQNTAVVQAPTSVMPAQERVPDKSEQEDHSAAPMPVDQNTAEIKAPSGILTSIDILAQSPEGHNTRQPNQVQYPNESSLSRSVGQFTSQVLTPPVVTSSSDVIENEIAARAMSDERFRESFLAYYQACYGFLLQQPSIPQPIAQMPAFQHPFEFFPSAPVDYNQQMLDAMPCFSSDDIAKCQVNIGSIADVVSSSTASTQQTRTHSSNEKKCGQIHL